MAYVGEGVWECRPSRDLKQEVWEINPREQRLHVFAEHDETLGLGHCVERREHQGVAPMAVLDTHGGVFGKVRLGALVGIVEFVGESIKVRSGFGAAAERSQDTGPLSLPGYAFEEQPTRVSPAYAVVDEDVATTQRLL